MLTNEAMIGFTWAGTIFASLPLFLRWMPTRSMQKTNHFSASAWFVYASFFCALVFTACISYRQGLEIYYRNSTDPNIVPGLGMPFESALNSMMVSLGEMQAFVLIIWTVKWSFMFMYYPMLPRLSNTFRYFWYAIMVWTVIGFGIVFPLEFIWCRPQHRLWSFEDDYCSSWRSTSGLLVGVLLNISADILIITFPIMILRSLTKTAKERAGVFFLAFIGLFVISASCTRLIILINRNKTPENATVSSLQQAEIWAAVESYAALWAVNLPPAKAFIMSRFFGVKEGSTSMTRTAGSGTMRVTRRKHSIVSMTESEMKIYGVGGEEDYGMTVVEAQKPTEIFHNVEEARPKEDLGPGFTRLGGP